MSDLNLASNLRGGGAFAKPVRRATSRIKECSISQACRTAVRLPCTTANGEACDRPVTVGYMHAEAENRSMTDDAAPLLQPGESAAVGGKAQSRPRSGKWRLALEAYAQPTPGRRGSRKAAHEGRTKL